MNTPTEFSENLPVGSVIGTFKANDSDGDNLTYQIAQGLGSNTHTLFSLDLNGTLKTAAPFDYENNATQYLIRVLVKDDKNASIQKSFLLTLLDVYEAPPNSPPSGLMNNISLSMDENLPTGTQINHFSAYDPDGNASLAFFLVDGNASLDNHLFLLERNGTLRTAALFDYESNRSSYFIRVQARDDRNASIEKSFSISLINRVEDHDGDGIEDHLDLDDDNDGFPDLTEIAYGSNPLDKVQWPIPCPIRWSSATIIFQTVTNWHDYRYFPCHGPRCQCLLLLSSTNTILR